MDSKTNNVPLIIGGIVVLAVIAYGAYAFMQKDTMMSESEMMQKEEGMMKEEGAMNNEGSAMDQAKDIRQKEALEKNDSMKMDQSGEMMKDDEVVMQKGSYEAYAPEKIARAATGDVVLFFHASWCPSCRGLNADIEKNLETIPAQLSILKVDYDTETELKKKYGVTYQHTLVQVDKDGNLIKKWSGSSGLSGLISEVE